jgi:hypothetical protein
LCRKFRTRWRGGGPLPQRRTTDFEEKIIAVNSSGGFILRACSTPSARAHGLSGAAAIGWVMQLRFQMAVRAAARKEKRHLVNAITEG